MSSGWFDGPKLFEPLSKRLVCVVHMSSGLFNATEPLLLRTLSTRLVGEVLMSCGWFDAFRTTM